MSVIASEIYCDISGTRHQAVATADVRKVDVAELIRACDEIIEAEVVSVHDVETSVAANGKTKIKLLELRVHTVLWGETGTNNQQVVAGPDTLNFGGEQGPRPGDIDVWFIERWHDFGDPDSALGARLREVAGTSDVMQVVASGRARFPSRVESGRRVVWIPTYSIALSGSLVGGREDPHHHLEGWSCTDRSECIEWLARSVHGLVPSIDATIMSNGPVMPYVSIDPRGQCRFQTDEHEGQSDIGTKELARLIDLARSERFFDLPADLGHSIGPDSAMISIRIRTANGSRLVRIHGPVNEARDGASAVDALARAKRVLHAIPHAKDWRVEQL